MFPKNRAPIPTCKKNSDALMPVDDYAKSQSKLSFKHRLYQVSSKYCSAVSLDRVKNYMKNTGCPRKYRCLVFV